MSELFQNIVVVLIILGAAIYLGRRFYRTFNGSGGCGCPSNPDAPGGGCARMAEVEERLVQMTKSPTKRL